MTNAVPTRRPSDRHANREVDVLGIPVHQFTQTPVFQILAFVLAQVQGDGGAARCIRWRGFDGELVATSRAVPSPGFIAAGAARGDADPVGDDERRIETDAKMAAQLRIATFVFGQARKSTRLTSSH